MSERRHRLYNHEIPEVIAGLRLHLERLVESKEERERAETVFRALYRLTNDKPGRPKYPEFSWGFVQYFLDWHDAEE